ncbi:AAA family ATPase [Arsenophonus sp. aPb]|uniref:AAA family ATPase n=1 Tax=Arsenophonus sp. aPb TaxID=3041619 RepID=UPI002468E915|nr:AAA family ATPase [Arsenophonus sp. aPb]WGL99116.1 AAA family ATPase [Arsenophonus sp. aPb]
MKSYLKKAERKQAYAKIGIYGDAGSGKTRTATEIAIGLWKQYDLKKPVAMFDTEPAATYIIPFFEKAGIEFYVYDESRALKDLVSFWHEAEKACSVIIVDSITHIWKDCQDSYLKALNAKRRETNPRARPMYQLEFHHWKPIKAQWSSFTDLFLSSKIHAIVCGRAGSIYEYQKNDETGKMELITSGTKMATEKEMGYEPSLLIEMIKHREDGRIINRALVEKDRTDRLNGKEFDFPNFETFSPHFDFLNIGGQHFGSMETKDSSSLFENEITDNGFSYEKKQREIMCEEIKGLFVKYSMDGNGQQAKEQRQNIMEEFFGTRSWTAIENMKSSILKEGFLKIKSKFMQNEEAINH